MSYDETYANIPDTFGADPEPVLTDHLHLLDRSAPVLDIGAGQGRHALHLARVGFTVDALDPSRVANETMAAAAVREGLPVRCHRGGFADFAPEADGYGGILVFGLIQILTWEDIDLLRRRLRQWTRPEGLVFVTGFTVADASFARYAQTWPPIGRNSFGDGSGGIRTYLEPGEIIELFQEFVVVHHRERWGPEHRHGDGPVERHAMVEVVLRR
jgi:cyclopropane fatty-acyl-phospholipid synthase-like methyltransferase